MMVPKPLFLRDRANVLIWSVAILDIDDDDVIVGWDVYLLVEGGLRGRILPWYNCTSFSLLLRMTLTIIFPHTHEWK